MAKSRTLFTVRGGYDKHGQIVRTTVPCTAVEYSDGGDDELCVWDLSRAEHGRQHHARDLQEPSGANAMTPQSTGPVHSLLARKLEEARSAKRDADARALGQPAHVSKPANVLVQSGDALQLLTQAASNMNKISQFMLKLEVRMGQVTKQAIRQTLDDTVERIQVGDGQQPMELDRVVAQVDRLSEDIYKRLYVVDKVLRGKRGGSVHPLKESEVKNWLEVETDGTRQNSHDPCYFTADDLASGRRFADWADYLKTHCGFPGRLKDEAKLVNLAWRLLDRNLRGPRPHEEVRIDDFVRSLEDDHESGRFIHALNCTSQQEEEDVVAWLLLRQLWSAKERP